MLASKELTGRYMHDLDSGPDSNVILAVTVTGYWVGGRSKFQVMFFVFAFQFYLHNPSGLLDSGKLTWQWKMDPD